MLNKSIITLFGVDLYYMDILLIITIFLYASVALIKFDESSEDKEIRKKINELEIKRKNYKFEEEMQRTLDKIITNYMLLYSPESFLPKQEEEWHFIGDDGKKVSSGEVVILLKSKYKKRIKNELEIIGISQKAIYPDMQNKSQYIKEKYL